MDIATKEALVDLVYPVGSLYWSSKSTDPGQLFGGTWTQIKDKFIYAQGSSAVNTTGGAKTVKITPDNLPSHTHSFTPSGTVAVATVNGVKQNPTFTGTAVSTGGMSGNSTGTMQAFKMNNGATATGNITYTKLDSGSYGGSSTSYLAGKLSLNVSHTHSVTAKGTISGGAYTFTGSSGTTGSGPGTGTALDKMPPYIVKYCWERIA